MIPLETLQNIPYFSGLESAELDSLRQSFFEKTAGRGDVISLEGEAAESLYFVASGVVKTYKTSVDGKEQILSIVRPGESFNDVPIFDGGTNPASAEAMGAVSLYGIRKGELRNAVQKHPQIAGNIIRILAERVRQLVALVEDLSFRHVIGRVARILLENASDGSSPQQKLTQQEMAAMAGTAREVVARSLKALEEEGTISLNRHRIIIRDRESLQATAAMPS